MRVFNEEMYFHFIGKVFLYSFLQIFRVYLLTAHARQLINLETQGCIYVQHYCLCPGYGRTIATLRIPSCILSRAGVRLRATFQTPSVVGQWNQAKVSLFDFEWLHSTKVTFSSVVSMPAS
jgi:hypothetical protein